MSMNVPFEQLAVETEGFSGSDMRILCREAAMYPLRDAMRDVDMSDVANFKVGSITDEQLRPISFQDLIRATSEVRASVSKDDLKGYVEWNKTFGSFKDATSSDAAHANSGQEGD